MEEYYNFNKVCRSCLKEELNMKYLFDVVISTDNQVRITDFIRRLTSVKIAKKDGLPENICKVCIEEICKAYNFAHQCVINNSKLKLQKQNSVVEVIDICGVQSISDCCDQEYKLVEFDSNHDGSELVLSHSDTLDLIAAENDAEDVEINHRCLICGIFVDSKANLIKHEKEHESMDSYRCLDCNKAYSKLNHLKVHSRSHVVPNKKQYTCCECGEKFSYVHLLKQHSYKHSAEKPFPCPKCPKGCFTAETLRRHMKVHEESYEKKIHICRICSKEFPYPSFLAEHMKNHTGEKPFLCSICGKGFRQRGALEYHTRTHTGLKPHRCDECEKYFSSQGVLKVHMRKHTNERPYICDVCGMAFRQSTDMRSHYRTHTGDKPVLCTICGKRMATTGQLTIHMRTHTGEKPFACKCCEKAFATRTMLNKHERTHTGEKPYVCPLCGKAFTQNGSLKSHAMKHKMNKKKERLSEQLQLHVVKKEDILINDQNCLILDLEEGKNASVILLPAPVPMLQN